jgi:glucose 1-dehydrogenase
MTSTRPLQGQKAIVTGANSGIGRAIAIALGGAGADVVVNHRDGEDAAMDVVRTIAQSGSPEDIGRAAIFLASDESDYITGTSMYVDGGMTLYPEFASGG